MKYTICMLYCLITFICASQNKVLLKTGNWISKLKINSTEYLPFNMKVEKGNQIYIINGEEEIKMSSFISFGDSIRLKFPFYNSELVFKIESKKKINGYWVNYNKGKDYKIPFNSKKDKSQRFSSKKSKPTINLNGKWEVVFEPKTSSSYPAIGIFKQKESSSIITGTFLTETGDYRYLAGNIINDSLYLSCFDGSHAFLFKAAYLNNKLVGTFNSGKHWKSNWEGILNKNAKLKSPEKLTYLKDGTEVKFTLNDINGNSFTFPNEDYNNKVVIIQIMGTWCPNCIDETHYFKELHEVHKDNGLKIISICYEVGSETKEHIKSIKQLKDKLSLEYTFLVGGEASKNKAAEQFNMLNNIISFPTTIIIGRNGEVKLVHTGFNGPGTGIYYNEFVKKMNAFIESLLAQ